MEMILTGEQIKADHAKDIGLAFKVFKKENFMSEVMEFAHMLASKDETTLAYIKMNLKCSTTTT